MATVHTKACVKTQIRSCQLMEMDHENIQVDINPPWGAHENVTSASASLPCNGSGHPAPQRGAHHAGW